MGIQTPVAQGRSTKTIPMIEWTRTSRLSIKMSLSLCSRLARQRHAASRSGLAAPTAAWVCEALGQLGQDEPARYRAVGPEQWLQRRLEAGSSWPSWPTASQSQHHTRLLKNTPPTPLLVLVGQPKAHACIWVSRDLSEFATS